MGKFQDLKGHKFGRLTVISRDMGTIGKKHYKYVCRCDCGSLKSVSVTHLKNGHTRSCGCLKAETCIEHIPSKYLETKHGMSQSKLYKVYQGMIQRCYNPKKPYYPGYGGRGVGVCDEWKQSATAFIEWALENGYEEGLSIDRIDPNGNYLPSNCRWVDAKTQMRNRRNTWFVSYMGESRALTEWCELLNLKYSTTGSRLRKGISVERAFEGRVIHDRDAEPTSSHKMEPATEYKKPVA